MTYIVNSDGSVEVRPIEIGPTDAGARAVLSGLRTGETVVTDGQLRLEPGVKVKIRPAPADNAAGGGTKNRRCQCLTPLPSHLRRRTTPRTRSHEPSRAVHSPAGNDDAADGGLRYLRVISYRALPVDRVDERQLSDHFGQPPTWPAPRQRRWPPAVATPLEGQFSTIAGLDSMSSTSSQGATSITLQFSLDRNIDAAAQDVQSAIAAAQRKLPPAMSTPPSFRKVNPADSPVFFIALSSPSLPLPLVNEYAETQLAQRISTISGVAQVLVFGSQKRAIRIQANPGQLAARDLGIDELQKAIAQATSISRSASSTASRQAFAIKDNGQLATPGEYRPLIVAWRNGAPIRLEDVATPIDSVENDRIAAWNVETMARLSPFQAAMRSFSTLSIGVATSSRRIGAPLRQATISGRYSPAVASWPLSLMAKACRLPSNWPSG